jgi:hypothetical protein
MRCSGAGAVVVEVVLVEAASGGAVPSGADVVVGVVDGEEDPVVVFAACALHEASSATNPATAQAETVFTTVLR